MTRENRNKIIIFIIVISGFLLRLKLSPLIQVMNVDAIDYFKGGVTLKDYFDHYSTFWTPLYPLMTIIVNYFTMDIEFAGKIVTVLAGSAFIFIIYLVAKKLYGETAGMIAGILVAFMPSMIYYSTFVTPEMLYLCFFYLSVVYYLKWVKDPIIRNAALIGVMAAAAYLTRPEGFLLVFQMTILLCAVILYEARKNSLNIKKHLYSLGIFIVAFFILTFPYLYQIKKEIGYLSISPRSGYGLALRADSFERDQFSLTEDRKNLSDRLSNIKTSVLDEIRFDPRGLREKYVKNIRYLFGKIAPQLFVNEIVLILFLVFLSGSFIYDRRNLPRHLMLIMFLMPVIITPLYVIEARSQTYIVPVVLILASNGIDKMFSWCNVFNWDKINNERNISDLAIVVSAMLVLLIFTYVYYQALVPKFAEKGKIGIEHKKAGLWLKNSENEKGKVMARKPWASFYSNNEFQVVPYARVDDMLYFARQKNVKYLIIDEEFTLPLRPNMAFLMSETPRGLRLIYDNMNRENKRVRIFQIEHNN